MPYRIAKRGDEWCVVKKDGSKTFGCHPSESEAKKQLAALYANTKEKFSETVSINPDMYPFEADGMVYRYGRLFQLGDYPDKKFGLTEQEAIEKTLASFDGPIPIGLEHTPNVLDGKLGQAVDISLDEDWIVGVTAIPKWLDDLVEEKKLSCEFDSETKSLDKVDLVLKPRITTAALMSAFSANVPDSDKELAKFGYVTVNGKPVHIRDSEMEGDADHHNEQIDRHTKLAQYSRNQAADARRENKRSAATNFEEDAVEHELRADFHRHMFKQKKKPKDEGPVKLPQSLLFNDTRRVQAAERGTMSWKDKLLAKLLGGGEVDEQKLEAAFSEGNGPSPPVTTPPAPAPNAVSPAPVSFAETPEFLSMRAQIEQLEDDKLTVEAERFADTEIAASRAYPYERTSLIVAFKNAARDDKELSTKVKFGEEELSRVEFLRKVQLNRQAHVLTQELAMVTSPDQGKPGAGSGPDNSVLFNQGHTTPDSNQQPPSEERVQQLLSMSPLGSDVLRDKNGRR